MENRFLRKFPGLILEAGSPAVCAASK
jgi:hypothetical protein